MYNEFNLNNFVIKLLWFDVILIKFTKSFGTYNLQKKIRIFILKFLFQNIIQVKFKSQKYLITKKINFYSIIFLS